MKAYLRLFDFSQKVEYKIEILAGLTVTLALIPEAVAFSMIAGLPPLVGLYAAFVVGLVNFPDKVSFLGYIPDPVKSHN